MTSEIVIRRATHNDDEAIWRIVEPVLRAGETYALPREMARKEALAYWLAPGNDVCVAEQESSIVGCYYLRANQRGGGAHVANCGYVTAAEAGGRGIARAMCLHSLDAARERGFRAMQFNFVVSTNERAVRLWTSLGFCHCWPPARRVLASAVRLRRRVGNVSCIVRSRGWLRW